MENEKITAKIIRTVFKNNDNSYSIIKVLTNTEVETTIVGYIQTLSEDVFYDFSGKWTNHNTYGKQFIVESYSKSDEQSKEGVISYLSSSFFTGIGPVTATKIVNKLGINAVSIILEDKNILKEFGFPNKKLDRFYSQLEENQINEEVLTKLYSYNITSKIAMRIMNYYGMLTIERIEEDPYQLIYDIEGIGFLKADEIASKIGFENDDPKRIKAVIVYVFQNYANKNGDIFITYEQLENYVYSILKFSIDLHSYIIELVLEEVLIQEDNNLYLYSTYYAEVGVANELKRLTNKASSITNYNLLDSLLDIVQIKKNIEYTELQKEAILNSLKSKVSIITGGPGTGKTTIIDGIIEIYTSYFKLSRYNPIISDYIGLMAPTGRAAKRMEQVLDLTSNTIHRQLGYGYDGAFVYDANKKMQQKLIIIDESSMIDIYLAKRLLEAINDDAIVIIVGDVDQLPSVGPGAVLKDIIESNKIPVVRLDEIHRQAKNSNIIKLASKVNNQVLDMESLDSGNDLFLSRVKSNELKDIIINQIRGALNQGYDMIEDIQVLIPTYKGDNGIDNINKILQENFNNLNNDSITYMDNKYYVNDKVIQLVNDPKNFVMNGDIGFIERISKYEDNKDYVVINFDGNRVTYDKNDLENISLAYAMSIHKSQGSEYKIVILPLTKQYIFMLKKELLYTAITRAKDYLIILGDMELLIHAANNLVELRNTSLKRRLEELL